MRAFRALSTTIAIAGAGVAAYQRRGAAADHGAFEDHGAAPVPSADTQVASGRGPRGASPAIVLARSVDGFSDGAALREESLRIIRGGEFWVRRKLGSYGRQLGTEFLDHLDRLDASDHYLDSGAGECVAVREYLAGRPDERRASVTAVSYFATQAPKRAFAATPRAELLVGRRLEEIPDSEVLGSGGKFAIISDVYGVLSYADAPGAVLARYCDLLAEGGKIYLFLGAAGRNRVRDAHGFERSLVEWITARPGLSVRASGEGLIVEVSDRGALRVPPLRMTALDRNTRAPYARQFSEVPL